MDHSEHSIGRIYVSDYRQILRSSSEIACLGEIDIGSCQLNNGVSGLHHGDALRLQLFGIFFDFGTSIACIVACNLHDDTKGFKPRCH